MDESRDTADAVVEEADDSPDTAYRPDRRRMLKLLGAVGVTGLAGCGGDDGEDTPTETDTGGNGNGNGNGDMTDTETDPTGTPTSTPAEPLDPPADLLSLSQNPVSTSSGETVTLEGAVQNAYLFDVHDISVTLSGPEGWSIAEPERTFERLDVGASESVSWEVSVPEDAIGTTELTATTTYASASDEAEVSFPIEIIVIEPADISEPDAYYSLDTDTPVDDSSNGHDGTIQGDVTTGVTGQSGSAYEFDAADGDHVSTSEYYPVTGSDARTTSAWVNIPSSIPSEFGPYARVVAWGGGGVGRRWDLSARDDNITGDGVVTPALEVNGASLIGSTQINDGTWHHIAITFPLSGSTVTDAQLYVDGSPESIATTNNGSRTIDTSTSQSVVIGGNGGSNELEGAVDEVRIYDEELTADQINQLYNDEQ